MKKKMMGITAFTVLVLSACSTTSPTTDSGQQEEQGAVAQEIQVSTAGALSTLDSGQYTDVNSSDMIGQVAEGLYRLDQEGDPELAMAAEEPTVSEDGLVYTFTIRDAKWSNGDPVTADDFVYAFQYVANPENGSSSSNQMDVLKNGSQVRQGDAEVSELVQKHWTSRR